MSFISINIVKNIAPYCIKFVDSMTEPKLRLSVAKKKYEVIVNEVIY